MFYLDKSGGFFSMNKDFRGGELRFLERGDSPGENKKLYDVVPVRSHDLLTIFFFFFSESEKSGGDGSWLLTWYALLSRTLIRTRVCASCSRTAGCMKRW